MLEKLSATETYEDPEKISIVVDVEGSEDAVVKVIGRTSEELHKATLELIREYPTSPILHFAGVDLLREQ